MRTILGTLFGVDEFMPHKQKNISVVFFRTLSGNEPVREWLLTLSPQDRKVIGVDLMKVEFGWPIGMPVCRPLGQGLWEVRSNLPSGRIARVLFCMTGADMFLLTGFIKTTQKTPSKELAIARSRQAEVMRNE